MIESFSKNYNNQRSNQWKPKHFLFSGLWLGIAFIFGIRYGNLFFLYFPFTLLFSTVVIIWFLVGTVFVGYCFNKWRFKEICASIIIAFLVIPPATYLHVLYLDSSAEKALRSFISYARDGDVPDYYIINDTEGLQCFSEDITSTYQLKSDFFFGVYDWWIEFEDGTEYYICTTRESLVLWEVNVSCHFNKKSE